MLWFDLYLICLSNLSCLVDFCIMVCGHGYVLVINLSLQNIQNMYCYNILSTLDISLSWIVEHSIIALYILVIHKGCILRSLFFGNAACSYVGIPCVQQRVFWTYMSVFFSVCVRWYPHEFELSIQTTIVSIFQNWMMDYETVSAGVRWSPMS